MLIYLGISWVWLVWLGWYIYFMFVLFNKDLVLEVCVGSLILRKWEFDCKINVVEFEVSKDLVIMLGKKLVDLWYLVW